MELILVSKDSPSKELSNGILNLSRDSSQAEIESFQTKYLKQLWHKEGVSHFVIFHDLPPKGFLRTFFLAMSIPSGNKIS
jgi:hypothetical protein